MGLNYALALNVYISKYKWHISLGLIGLIELIELKEYIKELKEVNIY